LQKFFLNYNPSTALAFWLGGMQEDDYSTSANKNPKSRFVGFSTNPVQPLSDPTGTTFGGAAAATSGRAPLFDFKVERINDPTGATASNTIFRSYLGNVNVPSPYVYFRAEIGQHPFEYSMNVATRPVKAFATTTGGGIARPYCDTTQSISLSTTTQLPAWVNPTSYQILFCGFDNTFGGGNWYPLGKWAQAPSLPIPYKAKDIFYMYDNANYDDITNFAGGAVGDKVP